MKRFRSGLPNDDLVEKLNHDRLGAETVLNQRLILFLVVFAVVIVSALNAQKKILFLSLLFSGVVICWVLAYIVVTSARKVGYLVKEINAADADAKKIDRKGSGRSVRFLLGYFIPIFCSALLTTAFVTGAFGFMDPYLWPTSVTATSIENKVKEVGSEIKKQIEPKKDDTAGHFKSVDSVILLSKQLPAGKKALQNNAGKTSQAGLQTGKYSQNFKNVDSVIALSSPLPARSKTGEPAEVSKKQAVPPSVNPEQELRDLDSMFAKAKPQQHVQKSKELKNDTNKTKSKKKIPPSPNFENVDSVIAKPK